MSADNYIFLDMKTKKVYHCVASCVCNHKRHCLKCQKNHIYGIGKNLDEAMKLAETAIKDANDEGYGIEYGISTSLWCK